MDVEKSNITGLGAGHIYFKEDQTRGGRLDTEDEIAHLRQAYKNKSSQTRIDAYFQLKIHTYISGDSNLDHRSWMFNICEL